jgi:hypothetical protein
MPTTYAIIKGNQYMDATLYTGNGSSQSIVNAGGFSPDLVWIKMRSGSAGNELFDSVRGANLVLFSNATNAESNSGTMSAFNSNGFTPVYQASDVSTNNSGSTYVGWQWRASDSAAVTNNAGSITSTVSANTTSGFSVVTYTGTGANATVGHGLSTAPKMVIVKMRAGGTRGWIVYHASLGNTYFLQLNATTQALNTANMWQNTTPTSSVFSISTEPEVNQSSATYVAYCWAEVPGFSKIGSYVGNGNADGTFVYTGFRPEFVLYKCSSTSGGFWCITDGTRNPSNLANFQLFPNSSSAEATGGSTDQPLDLLSNGFKLRGTGGAGNLSGETYIYMAFAEMPTKYANAR